MSTEDSMVDNDVREISHQNIYMRRQSCTRAARGVLVCYILSLETRNILPIPLVTSLIPYQI